MDLTAPGAAVESSIPGGLYGEMGGTSMAAPHVSAAVALLIYEYGTSQTPAQITRTLCDAARKFPGQTEWKQDYGFGMLDMTSFIQPTTEIWAVLYSDGELVFQNNNRTDSGRSVTEVYEVNSESSSVPWSKKAEDILKVTIADRIQPLSIANWFSGLENLVSIDKMENLDTSKVSDMSRMFYFCSSLISLDVSTFDTSNVTDMSEMFSRCFALTSVDVTGFDTSNVTDMNEMFFDCWRLSNININGIDGVSQKKRTKSKA